MEEKKSGKWKTKATKQEHEYDADNSDVSPGTSKQSFTLSKQTDLGFSIKLQDLVDEE